MNSSAQEGNTPVYIYEIPIQISRELCDYLDSIKIWEHLALNQFQFRPEELQTPRLYESRGASPSDCLLTMWSNRGNHKIMELFVVLHRENLVRAMEILKPLIDRSYHYLISNAKLKSTASSQSAQQKPTPNEPWRIIRMLSKEGSDPSLITEIQNLAREMSVPRIDFEELTKCTNNWQSTLGKGGFGNVFSGEWKKTKVAIKQLNFTTDFKGGIKNSVGMIVNEMKLLNSCRHANVLQVYAFSIDEIPCLVFELMAGGNLHSRLKTSNPAKKLSWRKRFNIAMESCRGIQYLHTFSNKILFHGDIKPMNILLDR